VQRRRSHARPALTSVPLPRACPRPRVLRPAGGPAQPGACLRPETERGTPPAALRGRHPRRSRRCRGHRARLLGCRRAGPAHAPRLPARRWRPLGAGARAGGAGGRVAAGRAARESEGAAVSDRCILAVKFTPASAPQALRKAVGGFLRYVQYRDKHSDLAPAPVSATTVEGMLKYVAHRDAAASRGRLFGAGGPCGDEERRAFAAFVARSVRTSSPLWGRESDGRRFDRRRAVYRFVVSPERAEGLDLSALTK